MMKIESGERRTASEIKPLDKVRVSPNRLKNGYLIAREYHFTYEVELLKTYDAIRLSQYDPNIFSSQPLLFCYSQYQN